MKQSSSLIIVNRALKTNDADVLSYIHRFSFFSRDKTRGSQRRMPQMGDGFGSWAGKDDVYTEQAQEALQHM